MGDLRPDQHPRDALDAGAPSRRGLLEHALAAGAVVWVAGVVIPTGAFLWPARTNGPTKRSLELDPASVPPGTGQVIDSGGKPVLVLHLRPGEFRALSPICTHLGCIVHWDGPRGRIACPCHAGFFAPDGSVLSGPPPRPLGSYPCRVVGGKLRIEM